MRFVGRRKFYSSLTWFQLFYNKRSQFVSGVEAEKVSVSVGQRVCDSMLGARIRTLTAHQAINERIKELDIQDCKVRVSNVDSQESFKNIVVQVIGEMSNKAAPHRKFVQTFVLAEQPNGYFVLNDIFRYIEEDEEDFEPEEPSTTQAAGAEEPAATLAASEDPVHEQHIVEEVDHKLKAELEVEKASSEESAEEAPTSNGASTGPIGGEKLDDDPAVSISGAEEQNDTPVEDAEKAVQETLIAPEKPRDPDPTPVGSPPKPAQATPAEAPPRSAPAAPPKPAAPKTWANLVAANRVAAPAVPSPVSSASPAPSQPRNAPAPAAQANSPPAPTGDDSQSRNQANGNAGWQTAGTDNNRRQTRGQSISGNTDKDTILGYVKNVTDKVDASILKSTLNDFGKLAYFDVSRTKVHFCFSTRTGHHAN